MVRFVAAMAAATVCSAALGAQQGVELKSPDGKVVGKVFVDEGRLSYTVTRGGVSIVDKSDIGVVVDGVDMGMGVTLGEATFGEVNERYPWYGVKSEAVDYCRTMALNVKQDSGESWVLEARAYNDGFAYRYVLPGEGKRKVNGEKTNWRLPGGCQIWYQTNTKQYEGIHTKSKPEEVRKGQTMGLPITIELADGSYGAISEAGVFSYSGMTVRATGTAVLEGVFEDDLGGWEMGEEARAGRPRYGEEGRAGRPRHEIRTPWRVTMTGPGLNELVNCDIIHNVCPAPDKSLFPKGLKEEWIKPGRALWSWWTQKEGDLNSVSLERQKWWVDKAAEMGFEYVLVDAGWERKWSEDGKDKWMVLKELTEYAGKKNVKIWVWRRWTSGTMEGTQVAGLNDPNARRDFFKSCVDAGVVGLKIDFMDSESKDRIDFYTNTLQDAAKSRLMVNFHGANKPTGEARTFPNEMTREGIRGLEYCKLEHDKRDSMPAQHYASLVFTRFLAGHGDFTPCTFDPQMLKMTTVTLQLATAVAFTSPVMHWADTPELYLQSPAIEVLKRIPSVWDETVVLVGSRPGELTAVARRRNSEWFVAVINGGGGKREYSFGLSFLDDETYDAVMVKDKTGQPGEMQVEKNIVTKKRKATIEMDGGGGFVGWFSPSKP